MYIPTIGPKTAEIMIVGEAPGAEEEKQLKPFVGASGSLLNQVLQEVGLFRHEVMITNVARERPPGNNINYFFHDGERRTQPKDFFQAWILDLKREIATYRPNIIIALGDIAYWTLCGTKGIMRGRGFIQESTLVPGVKVLPTFHPAHVLRNWTNRFHLILDIAKAVRNSKTPEMPVDDRKLVTSISVTHYLEWLEYLKNDHKEPIALDIETAMPLCAVDVVGIAPSEKEAISFSFAEGKKAKYPVETELKVWLALAELLKTKPVIMQNGKFDMTALWAKNRVAIRNFYFDIMVAAHVIWAEAPRSLSFLTSICTNYPMWKQTASTQPLLYNAQDCTNTYAVHNQLKELLEEDPVLMATFLEEMKQNEVASMLEIQGVKVDSQKQEMAIQNTNIKIAQIESDLKQRFGKEVNVKSPKQLSQLLYIDLGLPTQYKKKKRSTDPKSATTDSSAMKKLSRETGNKDLDTILEVKKLYKLKTFLDIEKSPTGTVHTCYNITGATMSRATTKEKFITDDEGMYKSFSRWSSSGSIIFPFGSGNLQNIPKEARKMYTAPPGYSIVQCDYKQAEAVVVAYLIGDSRLIELFQNSFGKTKKECNEKHWDVHKLTGSMMFGVPVEKVTKDLRKIGKMLRHATNYSAGPGVLANGLGIKLTEAKNLLNIYHAACPQLHVWHKTIQDELNRTMSLTNLLGRKHKFMERWGDDLFRSAYSYLPQSTVGDLLNKALVRLYQQHGDWLTIYLQLHDAIYVLVPDNEIGKAIKVMRETMLIPLKHKDTEFTIDTDFSVGKSWGEMEEVEWQDYLQ